MASNRYTMTTERSFWMALSAILLVTILFLSKQLVALHQPQAQPIIKPQGKSSLALGKINHVYSTIMSHYIDEVDGDVLSKAAISAMITSLNDPYSSYLDHAAARNLSDTVKGSFGGLGITIGKKKSEVVSREDSTPSYIEIFSTINGSPAARSGLIRGDFITAINTSSVEALNSEQAVEQLRGIIGSTVTLTILRGDQLFDITLTREQIKIETVQWAILPQGQGYIKVNQFTPTTQEQMHQAIDTLLDQQASSIIIDLRNNGGGSYDSAVAIANDFLDEGIIVSTKGRTRQSTNIEKATKDLYISKDIKIVVLINQYSASASEIVAGALRDHHRATLIGTTSYGKGRVQQVFNLNRDGSESFKLTVSSYFTPNGVDINEQGIKADIEVEPLITHTDENMINIKKLLASGAIENFIKKVPVPSIGQLELFAEEQQLLGVALPTRYIIDLTHSIAQSQMDSPPLFNLEFDDVLRLAVETLN